MNETTNTPSVPPFGGAWIAQPDGTFTPADEATELRLLELSAEAALAPETPAQE